MLTNTSFSDRYNLYFLAIIHVDRSIWMPNQLRLNKRTDVVKYASRALFTSLEATSTKNITAFYDRSSGLNCLRTAPDVVKSSWRTAGTSRSCENSTFHDERRFERLDQLKLQVLHSYGQNEAHHSDGANCQSFQQLCGQLKRVRPCNNLRNCLAASFLYSVANIFHC